MGSEPSSTPTAAAADPDCVEIAAAPFDVFAGWLEQPENWMSAQDFAAIPLTEQWELADRIAATHGCEDSQELRDAVVDYTHSNEYDQIWPAGCAVTDVPNLRQERTDAVLPVAESYVNDHPDIGRDYFQSDGWDDDVDGLMAELGCEMLSDHIFTRYTVEATVKTLVQKRDALQREAESGGGTTGGGGEWRGSIDVPDLNPFYCSWSFRGGFHCGVSG